MTERAGPRPSHFGLCVADLDAALRFYCDGLGFTAAERYDLDENQVPGLGRAREVAGPVRVTSQFIRHGAVAIELLHYDTPQVHGHPATSRGQLGLTHLALHVDALDPAIERAVAAGGTVVPDTRAALGVELVFLADPDGNRVELLQMG
jgi:lactoylglutathione lyase